MAPHSSTLAWKIPWTEEPGRLQSTGSLRVRHDWATSLSWIGEVNGNPLQCSCLENPRDGWAWRAAIYGVAQSWTRLKWLSSGSSSSRCFSGTLLHLMIQQMLAIWSLVPLLFLNPVWTSGSSQFTYCWSLAWRILSIILLACEINTTVQ